MSRRTDPLAAARAALVDARAALASAEQDATAARDEHATARTTMEAAKVAYGDAPTVETEQDLEAATSAARLAKLRSEGARRKLDAARELADDTAKHEARAALAFYLPRADRAALFDGQGDVIATIAKLDAASRVDVHQRAKLAGAPELVAVLRVDVHQRPGPLVDLYELTDRKLAAALAKQAERDLVRAMALRSLRVAVAAQHAAVDACTAACATLGADAPPCNVAHVPEDHLLLAVAVEAYVLTRPAFDAEWWPLWFAGVDPGAVQFHRGEHAIGRDVAAHLAWARASLRSGRPSRELEILTPAPVEPPLAVRRMHREGERAARDEEREEVRWQRDMDRASRDGGQPGAQSGIVMMGLDMH